MILAGDVGGTKILVGLFRKERGRLRAVREATFASREAASAVAPIRAFLDDGNERPDACVLGVAAPVVGGRCTQVNLPWTVDARRIAAAAKIDRVTLINDVEAAAWGLRELPARRIRSLTPGLRARPGVALMVAPGTGLGTATLLPNGDRVRPHAAEGGHASWAPTRPEDLSLWRTLSARHGRVSIERVVSGPGLEAIFDDVVASGVRPSRRAAGRVDAAADRAATITELALAGRDRAAVRALDRFVRHLGAAAGDLALSAGAIGGVYLAGGIVPKILPRLGSGGFLDAFRDKGRLTSLVSTIPVRIVLEPRCALIGAATYAALDRPDLATAFARRRNVKR